ncbi:MAG: glucose-6-phosphate dehydrogenase assembly protein OpcA [Simkaniaceae bacterium]|nr:glucose-6-phosphate dehydrogenase assembly protein OpcA [Simkaniaceae bacterium]
MTSKMVVHPAEIEEKLVSIWDEMQGSGKMRACLFNLVIYSKKDQRAAYLQKVAQSIIQKFPSRILFITEDTDKSEGNLVSSVSVLNAEEQIYCDWIDIEVSGDFHNRVPFVILPHLLPDLPIYLVWGGDPCSIDPVTLKIEKFASRTIFDSETSCDMSAFAKATLEHQKKTGCDIADLNWARIESWRHLFASLFYNGQKRSELATAKKIIIQYNSRETDFFCHTKTQAIYLSTWLATILGWQFSNKSESGKDLTLTFGEVEVVITPDLYDSLPPGRILSVEVQFNENDKLKLHRQKDAPHQVDIETCEKDVCKIASRIIFEKESSGSSLVNEVCHPGTSSHYLRVLEMLLLMELDK